MLVPALLAAALLQATAPQDASAGDAPQATSANATGVGGPREDTPSGAPADDYGFVNWCKGALTGHMELYSQVKPELARLEAEKAAKLDASLTPAQVRAARAQRAKDADEAAKGDEAQLAAGREYLQLYDRAILAGQKAGGENRIAEGQDAQEQGYRIWSAARAAPARTRMWSWLMWELPARCETAAHRLESQSDLFGAAFRSSEATPAPASPAPPAASTPPQ